MELIPLVCALLRGGKAGPPLTRAHAGKPQRGATLKRIALVLPVDLCSCVKPDQTVNSVFFSRFEDAVDDTAKGARETARKLDIGSIFNALGTNISADRYSSEVLRRHFHSHSVTATRLLVG